MLVDENICSKYFHKEVFDMDREGKYEQIIFQMKASKLYFIEGYEQKEIGKMLGCSTATVSRALKKAREKNMIEIKIKNPLEEASQLEQSLRERYELKEAVVVRGVFKEPDTYRKAVGVVAAELASNILQSGDLVGISSGRTIYEMIRSLPLYGKKINLEVLPLLGGMGIVDVRYQINELTRMFAESFKGKANVLNVPLVVKEQKTRDLLLEERTTRFITQKWKKLNKVFISIGNAASDSPSLNYWYSDLNKKEEELIFTDSVGDICGRFFDSCGEECKTEVTNRIISLNLEQLKKVKTRIGIVTGPGKIEGLKAALLKGLINIVVTDAETARGILDKH